MNYILSHIYRRALLSDNHDHHHPIVCRRNKQSTYSCNQTDSSSLTSCDGLTWGLILFDSASKRPTKHTITHCGGAHHKEDMCGGIGGRVYTYWLGCVFCACCFEGIRWWVDGTDNARTPKGSRYNY